MNLVGIALKVVLILFCWVNSTLLLSCTASYVGIVWLYVLYFAFESLYFAVAKTDINKGVTLIKCNNTYLL